VTSRRLCRVLLSLSSFFVQKRSVRPRVRTFLFFLFFISLSSVFPLWLPAVDWRLDCCLSVFSVYVLYMRWSNVTVLCDFCVVGQHGVRCEAKWWSFVAFNPLVYDYERVRIITVLLRKWCRNFSELAPRHGMHSSAVAKTGVYRYIYTSTRKKISPCKLFGALIAADDVRLLVYI